MEKNILKLFVGEKRKPLNFEVKRLVNVGYSGRNIEETLKHIEELKAIGVPAPEEAPNYYPKSPNLLTTNGYMLAVDEDCSGEAEYVLLIQEGKMYVGCGADVFDREVEAIGGAKSKHLYANQMSNQVWEYEDVKEHWDEIILRSWIGSGKETLYQEAKLEQIMTPEDILEFVKKVYHEGEISDGTVIFSGSVTTFVPGFPYMHEFTMELSDEKKDRTIECKYKVEKIKSDWK